MMKNARKRTDVVREHGDPFVTAEDKDEIYNLLTKEVMTEKVSKEILERDEIGQRMFVNSPPNAGQRDDFVCGTK